MSDGLIVDDDGTKRYILPEMDMIVLPDGESKLFIRNGIKLTNGKQVHKRYLVGELDGVRAYLEGSTVILTRQDLYP